MYLIVIFKCCKYIQFRFYTINHRHQHRQAAEIHLRWFIYIGLPCPALAYAIVNILTAFPRHYSQPVSKYSNNFKKYNQLPVPWNKKSESLQHIHTC